MKKRGLYLCQGLTPLFTGANIYSYGVLERVSEYFSLDVLSFSENEVTSQNKDYQYLSEKVSSIQFFEFKYTLESKLKSSLRYGNHFQKTNKDFLEKVKDLLKNNQYDFVFIDHFCLSYLIKLVKNYSKMSKIVFLQHNIEHNNFYEELALKENKLKKIWNQITNFNLKNYELGAVRNTDFLWCISELDKEYFAASKDKSKIFVIAPYFNYKQIKSPEQILKNNYNLLFLGSMFWYPNIAGVKWFIEKVFNKLVAIDSRYKFYIVGNSPTEAVLSLKSDNIIVTGRVESVDEYIINSDVMIVPLFNGGGVKIKNFEAIMKGIPVIARPESIIGYPKEIFTEEFCTDDPDKFIENILNLNKNPEKKLEFVEKGIKLLSSYSCMADIIKGLEESI